MQEQNRGRGRVGQRGRGGPIRGGRGNRQPRNDSRREGRGGGFHTSSSVPRHSSLHPNQTPVSIILKRDQPTGHLSHGIVADILTRGDHPRGVKVRLRDGRVGRVQEICSLERGEAGEREIGGVGAVGEDGEVLEGVGRVGGGRGGRGGRGRGGFRHERDVRENDEYLFNESASQQRGYELGGLFRALEEADLKHTREKSGSGEVEVVVCPVCGDFEGDERAVAFHVEGHFGN